MKAARQTKLEAQLSASESELRERLLHALPHTAEHGDFLFYNSQYRPEYLRSHQLDPSCEPLISLSNECVALREQLGLAVQGSPGQLYISACIELANTSNGNRRGPRQLAAWLLNELRPN